MRPDKPGYRLVRRERLAIADVRGIQLSLGATKPITSSTHLDATWTGEFRHCLIRHEGMGVGRVASAKLQMNLPQTRDVRIVRP